jgi:hypothetical protein
MEYVRSQIRAAGGKPERVFTDEALRAVHQATDGIPRLINQVCDHALLLASLGRHKQLDAAGIEEAWADLQQLPAPWHGEPAGATSGSSGSGVVEFGQLDEQPLQAPSDSLAADSRVAAPRDYAAAEQQLDRIEQHLAAARDDEEFQPVGSIRPEVELVFHGPHDPFGQPFDEEEVVIDRYASLEAGGLRRRPRVSSDEGRQLAAALAAAERGDESPNLAIAAETRHPRPAAQASPEFDPAHDPVMPEPNPRRSRSEAAELEDDSDLIVVDDGFERRGAAPVGRARRQEYRQLFAKLRRG